MEVNVSRIPAPYPSDGTLDTIEVFQFVRTGLSPSEVFRSRKLRIHCEDLKIVQKPHLLHISVKDSVCPMLLSIALTYGISLISFPADTKTFQFSALAVLTDSAKKSHSEISGSKHTYCSPEHNVVSHILHRLIKPSHPPSNIKLVFYLQ